MTSPGALPRVILLEDDASLRRYAQLALEGMAIEFVACSHVSEALNALRQAPARLVLTDLMLAGESGFSFLEQLSADARLRGDARVVVLSAGLTPEIHQRMSSLGVWRALSKPIGLKELERCVEEALAPFADDGPASAAAAVEASTLSLDVVDEAQAIARHFEGDAELYRSFRQSCLQQFGLDAQAGDAACDAGDVQALRRVAHNLKTVLRSLGHVALGDLAASVEDSAAAGDFDLAQGAWCRLQPLLQRLATAAN
ncbi:response regulator [Ideonella sp.]|uniref:response regulator n=1 Tax=Ideonella sp. TaxID=1929293 RepID=UPI0035B14E61